MIGRRDFLTASGLLFNGGSAAAAPATVIEGGFLSAAGASAEGWYAAVVVLDNGEDEFCRGLADPGRWVCQNDSAGFDAEVRKAGEWRKKISRASRRLIFGSRKANRVNHLLASAERMTAPAVPKETSAEPLVVWASRSAGEWSLMRSDGTQSRVLIRQQYPLRIPSVALTSVGPIIACEVHGPFREVQLFDAAGTPLARFRGERPRLAAAGDRLYLLLERAAGDSIRTFLLELDEKLRVLREFEVPARNDYTWKGDLLWDSASRSVHVVVESCEAFGMHEQLSLTRDLYCWSLRASGSGLVPALGPNRVPAGCDAAAVMPRLFMLDGTTSVAFRQYRVQKQRGTFGWDVWLASWKDGRWDSLCRVTANYGNADTGYDILEEGGRRIGVFPCRSHLPGGHITARYWTEVVELPATPGATPPQPVPCVTTRGPRQIGIEPDPLPVPPSGLQLLWADLHCHSSYSTCQPATNGSPEDHLRFVRDVLGCQVLTLSEHGHHMTAAESIYVQDCVEEFAGSTGIVLYSDEPNPEPGRHTNFYTASREVFEQLRTVFLSHGRARADVYRHIRQALPAGSVLAISHFHGKPLPPDAMRATFDPSLDVAMEAMQIRGNVMLDLHRESNGLLFPNDCLNMGLRLGLVGGTDHTLALDKRANHYCLTGLWVRERTAEGVMEALRARRTTAMSNGKMAIWATLNGQPAGSEVAVSGSLRIHASLGCGRTIKRAGLMRDGAILAWTDIGARNAELTLVDPEPPSGHHWYGVTAEMDTAYPTAGIAHASPFFVMVTQ